MKITVNYKEYEVAEDKKLMDFLRNDLHLHSVKDGCSEGACGACHVLIDGKSTKACVQRLSKLEGKHILTVEGLSEREREIFVRAFGDAGAVQCGFCIPGMVISAKALLDVNDDPTEEEVRKAIRNNICRCTGYKKIVDAILLAAKYKKMETLPEENNDWTVGSRVPRLDVPGKVLGTGKYANDIEMEGMVYGSAIRSKYPRAKVLSIDASEALKMPGVLAVYTSKDVPGENKIGHIMHDWNAFIPVGGITRFVGDCLALVICEKESQLEEAKALVKIEYEELEPVTSPKEAMMKNAPKIHSMGNLLAHKHISRGNAVEAIEKSAHVLHKTFTTPFTEHAFLEPECAVAFTEDDGSIHVYTSDQGVFAVHKEITILLGMPRDKVKVENALVGGGFGGKEDSSVQHLAALGTYYLKRPVKVRLTRQESINFHPKRHAMEMDFTVGVNEEGIIQGAKVVVVSDTGAYASLGGPVLERACTHAAGPYNYQNFEADGYAYYTNNPPAGAFRGFGVTQTCFCMETMLTLLAEEVGISSWEIRYRNAIRPGQEMPNGQIADPSTGLAETLEAVKDIYDANPGIGIACCMKNAGVGVGLPDFGRVILKVIDGKVHIRAGASCIGQGLGTILTQMVVSVTGLKRNAIVYDTSNTFNAKDSGMSSGSRQTTVTGEACRRAALLLKDALSQRSLPSLEDEEFYGEYYAKTDAMGADVPNPVSHVAYGFATQLCILNEDGTIKKMIACHDVGKAINPLSVEGQIEGGVVMSLGFALTEDFPLENCVPKVKYGTLGLFRADKVPPIETIIVEKPGLATSFGGIGIGEITSIPTAPAIAMAYYHRDGEVRTSLPLANTPYSRKKAK